MTIKVAAALRVILVVSLTCAFELVPGTAQAACSTAGTTTTCQFGDTVGPLYETPTTTELILEGGVVSGNALLFGAPLLLRNLLTPNDLILTTSDYVAGDATATLFLLRVSNSDGLNTLSFSSNSVFTATDVSYGIHSQSNAVSGGESRIALSGQLTLTNSIAGPAYGILNEVAGGATSWTQLNAGSLLSVSGAGAYGASAITHGAGGDAVIDSSADIVVRGDFGGSAQSALFASSDLAGAGLFLQGHVEFDNRNAINPTPDTFALHTQVGSGTAYSFISLTGTIDSFGDGAGGVWAEHNGDGPVEIDADPSNYIVTRGNDAPGLKATAVGGDVTIRSSAIVTLGDNSTALLAISALGAVTLENVVGGIRTEGMNSAGIAAQAATGVTLYAPPVTTFGNDSDAIDATITQSGPVLIDSHFYDIVTTGDRSKGINIVSAGGTVSVNTTLVETSGADSTAIRSVAAGATSIVNDFRVLTEGANSAGIEIESTAGDVTVTSTQIDTLGANAAGIKAVAAAALTITNSSVISTQGVGSAGIDVQTSASVVQIHAAQIQTAGASSAAIKAATTGALSLVTDAQLTTSGSDSSGLQLDATGTGVHSVETDAITTTGATSDALYANSPTGALHVTSHGTILTTGTDSRGVAALSAAAIDVDLEANVQTSGRLSAAVTAVSTGARVDVGVAATATLLGGWEATPGELSARTGYGAAGVVLGGDVTLGAFLDNRGTIGALSDRAVDAAGAGPVQIDNRGNLTGYLELGAGADLLTNYANSSWNIRNFVDTDGDAARDTKRVAQVAFGAGIDVVRHEAGAVLSSPSVVAGTTDTAYQYLPAGMTAANYSTASAGVEQIQLLQIERFEHRGLISLADVDGGGAGPVAGDIFLLSSGTISSTGVLTAASAPAVFVADGGSIRLDTVLNAGGANSRSDMLVLDAVALGTNGPSNLFINNAGGIGAATVGDGIKLVDVLGGSTFSAAGAFRLGAPVFAGAFQYMLYRSGVTVDDGDWYLRTQLPVTSPNPPTTPTQPDPPAPTDPDPPPTPPTPPTEVTPTTYRPEAALLAALPNMMRSLDASAVATHHRRVGDENSGGFDSTRRLGRSWARVLSEDLGSMQEGVLAPRSSGSVKGLQLGTELLDNGLLPGGLPSLGVYAGRLNGAGRVTGFANGVQDTDVGSIDPSSTFFGLYGTHRSTHGYYFDLVAQRSWYTGKIQSSAGVQADVKGNGLVASLEVGKGIALFSRWTLEPQLQIIAQSQSFDDLEIPNATVTQNTAISATVRLGLRVAGRFNIFGGRLQPYLRANAWKTLPVDDATTFTAGGGFTTLDTRSESLLGEAGAGLSWALNRWLMVYGEGSTFFDLDNQDGVPSRPTATNASLGLRISW